MATLTITLPDDLAATVRARVAAGEYPDEGAAIADALRDHDEAADVAAWLQREVPARLAAHDAGAEPAVPAAAVHAMIAQWSAARR